MDPLDGFEVMEEPPRNTWGAMGKAAIEFVESGNACMGKRYDDMREMHLDYHKAKGFVKNHSLPMRVRRRGNLLLFERKDDA